MEKYKSEAEPFFQLQTLTTQIKIDIKHILQFEGFFCPQN